MPKLLCTFRTAPTFNNSHLLSQFGASLRTTLKSVCNVSFNEFRWSQDTLPCCLGGLGISRPTAVAPAAYLAFVASTASIVCTFLHVDILPENPLCNDSREACGSFSFQASPAVNACSQASWTASMHAYTFDTFLALSDQHTLARLQGCSAPSAGDWLNAIPSCSLGLRLGAPVCDAHKCVSAEGDATAQHVLSCKKL